MATWQHLRSSTANKRPTTSLADGRIAINTNSTSPGLFFKDSAGTGIVKVGPVHVGTTAPNSVPAAGGSSGNYLGEQWLDTGASPAQLKVWNGTTWVGVVADELPVSKLQDGAPRQLIQTDAAGTGVEWTSNVDVPGTLDVTGATTLDSTLNVAGNVSLGAAATLTFEGATDDAWETTLSIVDPTSDRSILLPNVSGTVITSGDSGTVTSTMIADGTIVNADINASAAIAGTKISPDFGSQNTTTTGTSTAASFIPTSSTAPTNGLYLNAANSVALASNGAGRLFVDANGNLLVGSNVGSGGIAERLLINGVGLVTQSAAQTNRGLFGTFGGSTQVIGAFDNIPLEFRTNNTERLRITSDGKVGLGTSSPNKPLHIYSGSSDSEIRLQTNSGTEQNAYLTLRNSGGALDLYSVNSDITLNPGNSRAVTVKADGKVGVGTTSPSRALHVRSSDSEQVLLTSTSGSLAGIFFEPNGTTYTPFFGATGTSLVSYTSGLERCRVDGSGRLLVGTSTNFNSYKAQLESTDFGQLSIRRNVAGAGGPGLAISHSRGSTGGAVTALVNNDEFGGIYFFGADGTADVPGAGITAYVDGTPGANSMPGRIVLSTTASGASSPTERMRISNNGIITIKTNSNDITVGGTIGPAIAAATRSGIHFGIPASLIPTDGNGTLTDNACSLGIGAYRWSTVYAGTGTINTSDANLKQDIEVFEQAELNVAAAIKGLIKKFRFIDAVANKGDDARIHVGVIAQEVEQAFVDEGLDPRRYAMFCEDTLEDGSKRLGIRYDELLAFVIAAL